MRREGVEKGGRSKLIDWSEYRIDIIACQIIFWCFFRRNYLVPPNG